MHKIRWIQPTLQILPNVLNYDFLTVKCLIIPQFGWWPIDVENSKGWVDGLISSLVCSVRCIVMNYLNSIHSDKPLALACIANHPSMPAPTNPPTQCMPDYHLSLTPYYALQWCSLPRLTAADEKRRKKLNKNFQNWKIEWFKKVNEWVSGSKSSVMDFSHQLKTINFRLNYWSEIKTTWGSKLHQIYQVNQIIAAN